MNFSAILHREFRRYYLANIVALHGVWLQRVTLGWLAWSLTGQAGYVGLIAFLSFAPTLVTGPFFGVAADRVNLRRAALASQTGLFAGTAGLLLAHLADALGPITLALLAGGIGVATSANHPIRMALAPQLAAREALSSVVALTSLSFNLARLVGPALGGWLIARYGVGTTLAVNLACFLPFLIVLTTLRLPARMQGAAQSDGLFTALRAGIRHAAGDRLIRRALLLTGLFSLVGRGVLEILPVIADGAFARGPAGLGVLTAAAGCGAFAASITLAFGAGQAPGRLPRRSIAASIIGPVCVVGLGLTARWSLAVGLVALLGYTSTMVGVSMQSAVQLVLPDDFRGRVMSLWTMVAIGASALGAVGLGLAVDVSGLPATLFAAGGAGLLAVLAVLAAGRRA